MSENRVAKSMRAISVIEMICGALVFLVMIIDDGDTFPVALGILVAAIVGGLLFEAIGEIISLLQKNADKQDELLKCLKDMAQKENDAPKSVLQDIESNLPEM